MLNVEKYLGAIKSEIDANACASKSCLIAKVRRSGAKQDCYRTTCRDCEDESIEWLFSEYRPPLLENGDGLKTLAHVFFERFPDARKEDDETPKSCAKNIFGSDKHANMFDCRSMNCKECWKIPAPDEYQEGE